MGKSMSRAGAVNVTPEEYRAALKNRHMETLMRNVARREHEAIFVLALKELFKEFPVPTKKKSGQPYKVYRHPLEMALSGHSTVDEARVRAAIRCGIPEERVRAVLALLK
jgi:hypothetical protein